jgi:hypothetical protein
MKKASIKWLTVITMVMVCANGFAAQQAEQSPEKFVGKWDRNAGIISFFIKETNGAKQARMLVAEEHIDSPTSKLSIKLLAMELGELDELLEVTLQEMGDPESIPVRPIGSKEGSKKMGSIIYPNSNLTVLIIDPANSKRYVSIVLKTTDKPANETVFFSFWMDRDDLKGLKKLVHKALLEVGDSYIPLK